SSAFYNADIIWNARKEADVLEPEFVSNELKIHSRISIPDSAHRHYAYYLLGLWKKEPRSIPERVEYDKANLESCTREEIEQMLLDFDPNNDAESSVFVEIFNLTKEEEGKLFHELNDLTKKASTAASIDMNPEVGLAPRFVTRLMKSSKIFAEEEL